MGEITYNVSIGWAILHNVGDKLVRKEKKGKGKGEGKN